MEQISPSFDNFFKDENDLLTDLAEGSRFSFKRGDYWAINTETGEATFDPNFFVERGYTQAQALFASFHELRCHLVEVSKILVRPGGSEAHQRLKQREIKKERVHIWENCRTDIKGNLEIMRFAPALTIEVRKLYSEKLWPISDLRNYPKHLQFAYALLRRSMVPNESVIVDQKVEQAIEKLRNINGKDVIWLATEPTQDPLLALLLSEKYIEPVLDELFEGDLDDKNKQTGGQNANQDSFAEAYAEYQQKHPEPMDDGEEEKIIESAESTGETARYKDGYEQEHGVSEIDISNYHSVYQEIGPLIEPLREIFERIIEQRKVLIRRLVSLKRQGIMVDPGLVAQTVMDIRAGIDDPKTMKDIEGTLIKEDIPRSFILHLVGDQSSSMGGEKAAQQRKSVVLTMEALTELAEMVNRELSEQKVDLTVETELRSFGVPEKTRLYKPLSAALTETERIAFFNGLLETVGNTNDYGVLADIEAELKQRIASDPECSGDLLSGKKLEIVVVLTDGESSDPSKLERNLRSLRQYGVKVFAIGMTEAASAVTKAYQPDGRICRDVGELPMIIGELLTDVLGLLSVTHNQFDIIGSSTEIA